jgi:D-tyrosyl-tRNA(Tyr) deacylase
MKIVIQRVSKAKVTINGTIVAQIKGGLLVLIGIVNEDDITDVDWLCNKIANIRVFADQDGVMNKSLLESKGDVLLVSQFTLQASTKKGNRPSYIKAAKPEVALPLYKKFIKKLETNLDKTIQTGEFGADMQVELINDGPVTIIIDSKAKV